MAGEPHQQRPRSRVLSQADVKPSLLHWYAKCCSRMRMDAASSYGRPASLAAAENWIALGAGAPFLLVGASRRSTAGAGLIVSSAPLLYPWNHWQVAGRPKRLSPNS